MKSAPSKWPLFAILVAFSSHGSHSLDQESFELTILHTNDVHSHIEETNKFGGTCTAKDKNASACVGGVARIVTKVKELKQANPDALFVNGGDFYQGTIYYTLLKHRVVSKIMTAMQYDHVCLGNHEFDDGPKGLAPFLEEMDKANISVVSTNTDFSNDEYVKNAPIKKSVIITVKGRRIGIVGAVLPQTTELSKPGNVTFEDEIKSLKAEAAKLKEKNVTIIMAITHCGYLRDIEIITAVSDLDVIVGGHTNTFLYHGEGYPKENKVEGDYPTNVTREDGSVGLVVQAFCYGKFLGHLQVKFNSVGNVIGWGGNPILLDSSVKEDHDMICAIQPFKDNFTAEVRKIVGYSKVLLEHYGDVCRLRECNLGNLMADAYFAYYADKNTSSPEVWSIVNAALINGGGIRAPLPQGEITMEDILTTAPFGQIIVTVTLSGAELRSMFEHSVGNFSYAKKKGEFLQVSGIRVEYDLSMPSSCRVTSLKILCTECKVPVYEDVLNEKNYTIVTGDFVAKGGDGFAKAKNVLGAGPVDFEVLSDFIRKMSPIKTPIEGRIIIRGNVTEPIR